MASSVVTSGRPRRDVTLGVTHLVGVTLALLLADAKAFAAKLGQFFLFLAPELLKLSLAFGLLLLLPLDGAETGAGNFRNGSLSSNEKLFWQIILTDLFQRKHT